MSVVFENIYFPQKETRMKVKTKIFFFSFWRPTRIDLTPTYFHP